MHLKRAILCNIPYFLHSFKLLLFSSASLARSPPQCADRRSKSSKMLFSNSSSTTCCYYCKQLSPIGMPHCVYQHQPISHSHRSNAINVHSPHTRDSRSVLSFLLCVFFHIPSRLCQSEMNCFVTTVDLVERGKRDGQLVPQCLPVPTDTNGQSQGRPLPRPRTQSEPRCFEQTSWPASWSVSARKRRLFGSLNHVSPAG